MTMNNLCYNSTLTHYLVAKQQSPMMFKLMFLVTAKQQNYLSYLLILLFGLVLPSKSEALDTIDDSFVPSFTNATIKPYLATNMLYDSNFLRLSNKTDTYSLIGKTDKSEVITQASTGFDLDWTLSKQHISINADVNQNFFQNFTSLNYTGWKTKAKWDWKKGNFWDGEISYSNDEKLGSYTYINTLIPNQINNQHFVVSAGYLFNPKGKIKFGLFRNDNKFDDISRQISNNIEDNAELNLDYLSPKGGGMGLRFLATDGQYPSRSFPNIISTDNAYTRYNFQFTWDWRATSKIQFDGYLGRTQQYYVHLSDGNFAGNIGHLNLRYKASDKTLLELSAIRDIFQNTGQAANFTLNQGIEFLLTWKYSSKISLNMPLSYTQIQYLGGTNSSAQGTLQQVDHINHIDLNLSYQPLASISIAPVLSYEQRNSNNLAMCYETLSVGANLKMVF